MADPGNSYKSNPHVRQTVDKTAVRKNDLSKSVENLKKENVGKITYSNIKRDTGSGSVNRAPTKKDSTEYRAGFNAQRLDTSGNPKDEGRVAADRNFQNGSNEYSERNDYVGSVKKYGNVSALNPNRLTQDVNKAMKSIKKK